MTKAQNNPTQTLVAEMPERLPYSPAIAALFRAAAEPELAKADAAINDRLAAIAKMQDEIVVWDKHAAAIRQAVREVESNSLPLPPTAPTRCGSCQELIVPGEFGWVHVGRELKERGELCNPDRMDSPAAKPALPGELSADPAGLIANIEAAHDAYNATEGGRR